jgi:PAS domain S-box-containing protein
MGMTDGLLMEEKQAEANVKANEAQLQALMDASPVAISWSSLKNRNIIYVNRRFTKIFGYTLEDIPTIDDWLNKAYPDHQYRETIMFMLKPGGEHTDHASVEVWITCKDGSVRRVSRDWAVAAGRIIVTHMDITEWEQSKEALLESQARLSVAIDLAKAAPWSFNPVTMKYTFNDAYYALYGTTAEEQGGYEMSNEDFPYRFIHPDNRPTYFKAVQENANTEELPDVMQVEERALRSDGKEMYVLCRMKTYRDSHGRRVRLLGMTQDITEHKQVQAELAKRAEELARSNTELEQFVYVASHDLQEPLRMVASYTELLSRRYKGKLDSDADEFIAFAVDGANRMKRLINDLLSYSRVGTKGKPPQPANSESAFLQAMANLAMAIEDHRATVTCDDLPLVLADESQLVQLFQNLIANAIKFQASEAPIVHVSAELKDHEWVFAVRDNGIGIEPEYFKRIFLIFQRLHNKTEYPGTGIGLAICKRIVERHGGHIWVESALGKGSTFYFTFPAKGGKRL